MRVRVRLHVRVRVRVQIVPPHLSHFYQIDTNVTHFLIDYWGEIIMQGPVLSSFTAWVNSPLSCDEGQMEEKKCERGRRCSAHTMLPRGSLESLRMKGGVLLIEGRGPDSTSMLPSGVML